MLKRILAAVAVVIAGFVVDVALVSYELHSITRAARDQGERSGPLYHASILASETTAAIERAVLSLSLTANDTEFEIAKDRLGAANARVADVTRLFDDPRLASLLNAPVNPLPPTADNRGGTAGTLGALLTLLKSQLHTLPESSVQTQALVEARLKDQKTLRDSRETLSKALRRAMPLSNAHAEGFNLLSRAAIACLSSTSTSDLNFVGRAKLAEAVALLDAAELAEGPKKLYTELRASTEQTLPQPSGGYVTQNAFPSLTFPNPVNFV